MGANVLKSRMKRINSSYKLIELLSGRGSGADTIVNVATVELRFRAVVLIKKFVFKRDKNIGNFEFTSCK